MTTTEINGVERITMLDLYNDITGQAWSMFDSEAEGKDDFEQSVKTSINKALTELYNSYPFTFRDRTHILFTKENKNKYAKPQGLIKTSVLNGQKVQNVWLDRTPLKEITNYRTLDKKTGKPEYFYVNQDNIYLYPTPDARYTIIIDYLSIFPVNNEDEEEKATLDEETDYINIPTYLNQLFLSAIMPLTMWKYLIASETDENSSLYRMQYESAYKQLIKYSKGSKTERKKGW